MWLGSTIVASLMFLPVCTSAGADLFAVSKTQFSGLVLDDGNYTVVNPANNGEISRSKLDHGRLYFSFIIIGTDKSLRELENTDRLDVEVTVFAGRRRRDSIRIGIMQEQWERDKKNIIDKYNNEGFFNWRFSVNTRITNFSSVEMMIKDATHNVIRRDTVNIVP